MGAKNREFVVDIDGVEVAVPRRRTRKTRNGGVKQEVKEKFKSERDTVPPAVAKTEKQKEYFKLLNDPSVQAIVVLGLHGTGKAQPLYSKVLTPSGFVEMGTLEVGDTVRSQDSWTKVLGVYPQGVKRVYKFTLKDGSSVESCEDHIWTVDTNVISEDKPIKKKIRKDLTTREIVESLSSKVKGNISLPRLGGIEYDFVDFVIPPYVLGALIGDGSLTTSTPTITSIDSEILNKIEELICEDYTFGPEGGRSIQYNLRDSQATWKKENRLTSELKKLGLHGKLSNNKFIPEAYKFSTIEQRKELLRGLMDTDGTVCKRRGQTTYCTVSEQLAMDIKDIVLSIGGRASICTAEKYFTYKGEKKKGQLAYIVSINIDDKRELFNLSRKKELVAKTQWQQMVRSIDKAEYVGEVECQCIMVEDESHLYVTDDYILTHNTFCASVVAADKFRKNEISKIIVARAYVQTGKTSGFKPGTSLQKLYPYVRNVLDTIKERIGAGAYEVALKDGESGQIQVQEVESIRGRSFDEWSFLIIDEAQQVTKEEMKSIVTRVSDKCKLVLCGDIRQKDIHGKSGLEWFMDFSKRHNLKGVAVIDFSDPADIVRGGLVRDIAIGLMKDEMGVNK